MPDTALTRGEHNEFKRTVEAEIERLDAEDSRLNKRVSNLESDNRQITELTVSVQKLTDNIEHMRQLQEDESKRLQELESRDGKMWRTIISHIATTVVGIVIAYIFMQIGLG